MRQVEALIIGGGPAGAACADELHRGGVECLVLEAQAFPREKPCAGWITPQVWQELAVSPAEYPYSLTVFRGLYFHFPRFRFNLPTIQYAIRRGEFDHWLLQRSGVPVVQHRVRSWRRVENGFVVDDTFRSRYLVAAGGAFCPVARSLPALQNRGPLITALETEFPAESKDRRCRLWFLEAGLPGYSWLVPKKDGWLNLGIGGKAAGLEQSGKTLKEHWRLLVERLSREGLLSTPPPPPRGHAYYLRGSKPGKLPPGLFVVGDAAGLATRDLGEGIFTAIRSGRLAARVILTRNGWNAVPQKLPRYSWPRLLWPQWGVEQRFRHS